MKKGLIGISLVVLTLAILNSSALAAPPFHITPVSWIIATQHNLDVDDKPVTLVGEVIKPDGGSDWWFSDATGSVRLDTDGEELPIGKKLVIRGRIDQARFGIGYLEVEVKHWDYFQK